MPKIPDNTNKHKKLFFALWPDDIVRLKIHQTSKQFPAGGVIMAPGNLHITLVFIGHASLEQQQCLEEAASQISAAPLTLALDKIDHFGQRVLWMGCKNIPTELLALNKSLTESVATLCSHQPEKRRYRPHVTLQRKIRKPFSAELEHPIQWRVKRFSLIESIPPKKRFAQPCYQPIRHWELG